jgi:dimethyladenosine transferase
MQPRAKKSLGQHFLKNPAVSRRIVELLGVTPEDRVLEIGPGPGALTLLLAEASPKEFIILEKDEHWASVHAERFAGNPAVRVVPGDAMAFAWEGLEGPWKVISNLPYNVGSPLIWDMVSRIPDLARAVFMVQKEVAERLAARPDSRDYGMLSVWVQSFMQVEWGFVVGPGNFVPPPKVDSAVIRMRPLGENASEFDRNYLEQILKIVFQQRRKQLQSVLRKHGIHDAGRILEELRIDPKARPETLNCEKFHALAAKCGPIMLTSSLKHG